MRRARSESKLKACSVLTIDEDGWLRDSAGKQMFSGPVLLGPVKQPPPCLSPHVGQDRLVNQAKGIAVPRVRSFARCLSVLSQRPDSNRCMMKQAITVITLQIILPQSQAAWLALNKGFATNELLLLISFAFTGRPSEQQSKEHYQRGHPNGMLSPASRNA